MSCNKFSNKCARGIGILSKNQPKFDLMPSHGFWSGRLNVASVEYRTATSLYRGADTSEVDLKYGLWIETPGIYQGGGDLYSNDVRFDTAKMTEWIQGLGQFIEERKVKRLVVRLPSIEGGVGGAPWPDVTNIAEKIEYWHVMSRAGQAANWSRARGVTGSCIYSLAKNATTGKFMDYTLASLVEKYSLEILWLPVLSDTLKFAGNSATGGDINADPAYAAGAEPGYKDFTNTPEAVAQVNADVEFMVGCCLVYKDAFASPPRTGIVWEFEGAAIQWQYNQGDSYVDNPNPRNITYNPVYATMLNASDTYDEAIDANWTWGFCYFIRAGKEEASFPTIASLWSSSPKSSDYKIELFPEWYGWPGAEKAGPTPCHEDLAKVYNDARAAPSNLTTNLQANWESYTRETWNDEWGGNPFSKDDTPALTDLINNANATVVKYWKNIWNPSSDLNYKNDIINFSASPDFPSSGNPAYTALISVESYFFGGPPPGSNPCLSAFPHKWSWSEIDGWSQEIARAAGVSQSLNTMYFSATFLFPGLNNQTIGPPVSNLAKICGCEAGTQIGLILEATNNMGPNKDLSAMITNLDATLAANKGLVISNLALRLQGIKRTNITNDWDGALPDFENALSDTNGNFWKKTAADGSMIKLWTELKAKYPGQLGSTKLWIYPYYDPDSGFGQNTNPGNASNMMADLLPVFQFAKAINEGGSGVTLGGVMFDEQSTYLGGTAAKNMEFVTSVMAPASALSSFFALEKKINLAILSGYFAINDGPTGGNGNLATFFNAGNMLIPELYDDPALLKIPGPAAKDIATKWGSYFKFTDANPPAGPWDHINYGKAFSIARGDAGLGQPCHEATPKPTCVPSKADTDNVIGNFAYTCQPTSGACTASLSLIEDVISLLIADGASNNFWLWVPVPLTACYPNAPTNNSWLQA